MRLSAPFLRLFAPLLALTVAGCGASEPEGPVVLAASSFQEVIEAAADEWEARGHPAPVLSFAASSLVARQVAEGSPADIAITADEEWMDWLGGRGLIDAASRRNVAGNRLVLITRRDGAERIEGSGDPAAAIAASAGRLAIAEPQSVPAGRYARAALESLGQWSGLQDRIVPAENVRTALAFVERGEAELGIVYRSDAAASDRVIVLAQFDPSLHPPIRYPAALVAGSGNPDAGAFLAFFASQQGVAILTAHGFDEAE